ncbi:hypothetical protein G4B88_010287 [Cannabis sativa]|uniref:Uncharacterized protein n=1 Tax=Cannabis sativa TaxID=3483 RepID=A0A7J6I6M6_CANSA|nr:hypothetical protein G4B88_010287 [Cannabis sativa]
MYVCMFLWISSRNPQSELFVSLDFAICVSLDFETWLVSFVTFVSKSQFFPSSAIFVNDEFDVNMIGGTEEVWTPYELAA